MFTVAIILCLLVVIAEIDQAKADTPDVLRLWVLTDPSAKETIESVSQPDRAGEFQLVGNAFSAGFSRNIYWFRLQVKIPHGGAAGTKRLLEWFPAYLDDVRLYISQKVTTGVGVAGEYDFSEYVYGDRKPFLLRPILHRYFVHPVSFLPDQNQVTLYLRLETDSAVFLMVRAWEVDDFHANKKQEYFLLGVFLGFFVIAMAVSVVSAWRHRDPMMWPFLWHIFAVILFFMGLTGLAAEYWWPRQPAWVDILPPVATLLVVASMLNFYRLALGLGNWLPRVDMIVRVAGWIFLIALPTPIFGIYSDVARWLLPLHLLVILLLAGVSWFWPERHQPWAWLLLLGVWLYLAGGVLASLHLMGWIPANPDLIYVYLYGVIGSLMVMQYLMRKRSLHLRLQLLEVERDLALSLSLTKIKQDQLSEQKRFIEMLTHEVKTPLSILRLRLGIAQPSADMQQHAQKALSDIDILVEQLAQAGRIDEGDITPKIEACRLEYIVDVCIDKLIARGENLPQLERWIDASPLVYADSVWLQYVIFNLLDNANRYGDGVKVKLSWCLHTHSGCAGVALQVVNVVGSVGRPDPAKLFNKYYRSSASHGHIGTGLGLYISYALCSRMGANLEFLENQDDIVFQLWLPCSKSSS